MTGMIRAVWPFLAAHLSANFPVNVKVSVRRWPTCMTILESLGGFRYYSYHIGQYPRDFFVRNVRDIIYSTMREPSDNGLWYHRATTCSADVLICLIGFLWSRKPVLWKRKMHVCRRARAGVMYLDVATKLHHKNQRSSVTDKFEQLLRPKR